MFGEVGDERAPDVPAAAGDEDVHSSLLQSVFEHTREEPVLVGRDPVGVVGQRLEHVPNPLLEGDRLPVDQGGVAVVLDLHLVGLVLVAGVLEVFDGRPEIELPSDLGDCLAHLDDADRTGDLVVDSVVARSVVRVAQRQSGEPLDRVFQRDERFPLFTLPVDGDRVASDRLRAEPMCDDAEVVVEVEPSREPWVRGSFGRLRPVGDRGPHVADRDVELRVGQPEVRGVVTFRHVVPRACHRRERNLVAFAVVLHHRTALGDGELRRAVDTGGSRLDEVGVSEAVLRQPEHEVPGGLHVVVLGEVRPFTVDLGVRCRRLGGRVDDRLRLVNLEQFVDERPVGQITLDEREVGEPVGLASGRQSAVRVGHVRRRDGAHVPDPLPPTEVVDPDHSLVGPVCDSEGGRPPDVAVRTGDDDSHLLLGRESHVWG